MEKGRTKKPNPEDDPESELGKGNTSHKRGGLFKTRKNAFEEEDPDDEDRNERGGERRSTKHFLGKNSDSKTKPVELNSLKSQGTKSQQDSKKIDKKIAVSQQSTAYSREEEADFPEVEKSENKQRREVGRIKSLRSRMKSKNT
jgi:hypothetical protein